MVLAMMLACVPMASAATVPDDGGNYYEEYRDYDGVVRIPYGKITNLTYTKFKGAKYFEFSSNDNTLVSVPDYTSPAMYGVNNGATFVYVAQYDKNSEYLGTKRYIVVVYDNYDAELTGSVTGVHANDISMKCDESAYIDCNVDTDGDVFYYYITENITYNCTYTYGDDEIHSYNRGTDIIQLFVVDTNCNVVSTSFNVNVRFTFIQWIRNLFNSMFFWMYR